MARSGVLPSAEMPSNNTAIFISTPPLERVLSLRRHARVGPVMGTGATGVASQGDSLTFRSQQRAALNELVVAHSNGASGLRKARVVRRIGKDPRKGIHFHHIGPARR